jgi:hypothetical protein
MVIQEASPEGDRSAVADEQFSDLFALGQILSLAVKSAGYRPSKSFLSSLNLGIHGSTILEELKNRHPSLSEEDIKIELINEMYWNDLFFIPNETNIRAFVSEISERLSSHSVRIPWIYGGCLYRKANKIFDRIMDRLDSAESLSLLSDTPQGVCQMREFVSGPFGLLSSRQRRHRPPSRAIPLWHCSDPSCSAIHGADLKDADEPNKTRSILRDYLKGTGDGWAPVYRKYGRLDAEERGYYDDLNTGGLVSFLGDAFGGSELQSIVASLLSNPNGLRAYLTKLQLGEKFNGSAAQISSRLDEAECLQIILLDSDESIVDAIDRLIASRAINIPISETRAARHGVWSGWYRIKCEASCHGVRFVSNEEGVPLARLKRLIRDVDASDGNSMGLSYRLRFTAGDSTDQKLDSYVNDHSPEEALRDHVLVSPAALVKAFEIIKYGSFATPTTASEEQNLVKRMMWKLGFSVPVYPLEYGALAANIRKLQDANHAHRSHLGDDVARIRSEAVNVFVELERILSHSLVFMTWVLTSDHFINTRFRFEVGGHHEYMSDLFRNYQQNIGAENPIIFDKFGRNTFFPLISGFRLLADYCRSLMNSAEDYRRPASEFPRHIDRATLQVFPFRHTRFVLDLRENIKISILSELVEITTVLERMKAAGIRNRIEHNREDFPDKGEVSSFLDALVLLTERMQKMGIAPLSYTTLGKRTDKWGRVFYDFGNYRGETICIPYRAELVGSGIPNEEGFLIVVPSIKIGDTEEIARFSIKEGSDYQNLWKDYPIKQFKLQGDTA